MSFSLVNSLGCFECGCPVDRDSIESVASASRLQV